MRWFVLVAVAATLVACDGEKDGDSGAPDDSGAGGNDSGGGADPSVAPEVTGVELVECREQQSAGEVWFVQITANDPQGAETIASGTTSVINEQGGELASYQLICGSGTCTGNFRADYDSITCSLDGSITFRFTVTDEDGNVSDAYDHATR